VAQYSLRQREFHSSGDDDNAEAKEALCFTSLNFEDDMRIADRQQNTVHDPAYDSL
jgi:hypothetical protein